jgi:hypothetical protein
MEDRTEVRDRTGDRTDDRMEVRDRTGDRTDDRTEVRDRTDDRTEEGDELGGLNYKAIHRSKQWTSKRIRKIMQKQSEK